MTVTMEEYSSEFASDHLQMFPLSVSRASIDHAIVTCQAKPWALLTVVPN